jgi:hypothetical protein
VPGEGEAGFGGGEGDVGRGGVGAMLGTAGDVEGGVVGQMGGQGLGQGPGFGMGAGAAGRAGAGEDAQERAGGVEDEAGQVRRGGQAWEQHHAPGGEADFGGEGGELREAGGGKLAEGQGGEEAGFVAARGGGQCGGGWGGGGGRRMVAGGEMVAHAAAAVRGAAGFEEPAGEGADTGDGVGLRDDLALGGAVGAHEQGAVRGAFQPDVGGDGGQDGVGAGVYGEAEFVGQIGEVWQGGGEGLSQYVVILLPEGGDDDVAGALLGFALIQQAECCQPLQQGGHGFGGHATPLQVGAGGQGETLLAVGVRQGSEASGLIGCEAAEWRPDAEQQTVRRLHRAVGAGAPTAERGAHFGASARAAVISLLRVRHRPDSARRRNTSCMRARAAGFCVARNEVTSGWPSVAAK